MKKRRTIGEIGRILGPVQLYVRPRGQLNDNFQPGNRLAAAENMSAESNLRRMKGLEKATMTSIKRFGNHPDAPKVTKDEEKEVRRKVRYKVAKEAQEIQGKARQLAEEAMDELGAIIQDPVAQHSVKIQAISLLLDRAYGKSSQVNINASVDPDAKPKELTPKQLEQRIADTLKRVEEAARGVSEASASEERPPDIRLRH